VSSINATKTSTRPSTKAILGGTPQASVATVSKTKGEHLNWMGGRSWDPKDPILQLQIAAASSFFGEPQYYHDPTAPKRKKVAPATHHHYNLSEADVGRLRTLLNCIDPQEWRDLKPAARMVAAVMAALDHDVEATLKLAVELRQVHHIRVTPQVIMVHAALHPAQSGTGLLTKYAPQIVSRIDEVATQYAYYLSLGNGHTPPKSLKRNWARALTGATEYQLAKYRLEGRMVSLADVVNICHAKGPFIDKLMKGDLKLGAAGRQTWESIRSDGGSWADAAKVMGHMALLRNLRNLGDARALNAETLAKLVAGAAKGKQLPFRYVSAYKAVEHLAQPQLLDAIEECLDISIANMPHLPGRVASLSDNSGSAWGAMQSSMGTMPIATIGNLMGILTAKCADEGHVGVFGDRLTMLPVRKRSSVFDTLQKVERAGKATGMSTENGIWLFWKDAIEKKQHWDTVFIYSDMQAGHGGLYGTERHRGSGYRVAGKSCTWPGRESYIDVPMLIDLYRRKVNPKVHVALVQTAGYQDTLVPEQYDRTYIMGGWSAQVVKYVATMQQLRDGVPSNNPPAQ